MARITEQERLFAIAEIDRTFWDDAKIVLAGMDEVGRGPLAGPVVAGCVIMPKEPLIPYVNDSKKVTEKRREQVYPQIVSNAIGYATGWVFPQVIDEINILEATKLAFCDAFMQLQDYAITDVMIDALTGLKIDARQHSLIHGDARCYSIAAASIIAKVERDRYMQQQDELYPQYGFGRNKGYGTAEHIAAIKEFGPCPIHRMSFIKKWL